MNRTCEIHDTILQDDLKLRERPLKVLAAVDSFKGLSLIHISEPTRRS